MFLFLFKMELIHYVFMWLDAPSIRSIKCTSTIMNTIIFTLSDNIPMMARRFDILYQTNYDLSKRQKGIVCLALDLKIGYLSKTSKIITTTPGNVLATQRYKIYKDTDEDLLYIGRHLQLGILERLPKLKYQSVYDIGGIDLEEELTCSMIYFSRPILMANFIMYVFPFHSNIGANIVKCSKGKPDLLRPIYNAMIANKAFLHLTITVNAGRKQAIALKFDNVLAYLDLLIAQFPILMAKIELIMNPIEETKILIESSIGKQLMIRDKHFPWDKVYVLLDQGIANIAFISVDLAIELGWNVKTKARDILKYHIKTRFTLQVLRLLTDKRLVINAYGDILLYAVQNAINLEILEALVNDSRFSSSSALQAMQYVSEKRIRRKPAKARLDSDMFNILQKAYSMPQVKVLPYEPRLD